MAYKVFTSYAVLDRNRPMMKFMKRLSEVLRAKLGTRDPLAIQNLIFFDFTSIRPGDEWDLALAQAVHEAEMLVCLVSPTYLSSEWCGRELEVFHRRYEKWKKPKTPGASGRFIFPVLWEPPKNRRLPEKIGRFQFPKRELPRHHDRGLRNLADLQKYSDEFKEFVELLAQSISDAARSGDMLPGDPVVDFKTIPSAFTETVMPYDLMLWSMAPDGDDWKPSPSGDSVWIRASGAAAAMRVAVHSFQRKGDIEKQLTKLKKDRLVLLVIADARSQPGPELAALNQIAEPGSIALLLVDTEIQPGFPPRPTQDWLSTLPPGNLSKAVQLQQATSCRPEDVAAEMEKVATRVRLALISSDPPAKVKNAALERIARDEGIPTAAKASLTAPASR